jgi:hypothetical protein
MKTPTLIIEMMKKNSLNITFWLMRKKLNTLKGLKG